MVFQEIVSLASEPCCMARLKRDGTFVPIAYRFEEFSSRAIVEAEAGWELHQNRPKLVGESGSLNEERV